jgi:hypothetical protein
MSRRTCPKWNNRPSDNLGIAARPADPIMLDNAYAMAAHAVDSKPESALVSTICAQCGLTGKGRRRASEDYQ